VKLFELLFQLWQKQRAQTTDVLETMLAMLANVFPSVSSAARFMYACSTCSASPKPKYDDFVDSLSPGDLVMAVASLSSQLRAFMPTPDERLKPENAKGGGGPLAH
jgi:hypothetical protein